MRRTASWVRRVGWELRNNPASRLLWAITFLAAGLLLTVGLLVAYWLGLL